MSADIIDFPRKARPRPVPPSTPAPVTEAGLLRTAAAVVAYGGDPSSLFEMAGRLDLQAILRRPDREEA